jgi:Mrp family chromosome partitioning ATPase
VIDTPPIGLITDALVLIKDAEVALFVLNTKFPARNSLETAHEIAALNSHIHFGFILNGVRKKRSKYYYNRYGYGYSYSGGGYGGGYGGYGSYGSYGGYGDRPKKSKKDRKEKDE